MEGALALSLLLKDVAARDGGIVGVHLDVTYRCDLDCEHCYLDDKTGRHELPTSRWLAVLDELALLGPPALLWSGGEVFARNDFEHLLKRAHALGMSSRIKTHAGNIDDARAAMLAAQGVTAVEVSVYSLTPAVHDAVTRVPGSLLRTLDGIAAARRHGLRVLVSTVAMQSNFAELQAIDDYFFDLGSAVHIAVGLHPDQSSKSAIDGLGLDFDQMVEAYRIADRGGARRGAPTKALADLDLARVTCQAGRSGIYVTPSGEVWPCVTFPLVLGDLRSQSLTEIWRTSAARAELVQWTNADRHDCTSCGAGGTCSYCPGEAHRRTGDYRKAPPEFHARARAKIIGRALARGEAVPTERLARTPEGIVPSTRRAPPFSIRVASRPAAGPSPAAR